MTLGLNRIITKLALSHNHPHRVRSQMTLALEQHQLSTGSTPILPLKDPDDAISKFIAF